MKKYLLVSLILLVLPVIALAQGPAIPPGSRVTIPNPLGTDSPTVLINRVIDFLLTIAVPIAALVVLYAAFLFLTAGGNEDRVKDARRALLWAVVGIIILMVAKGIVNLVQYILTGSVVP